MCNEQDNFCDGNSSEELCKHCLNHSCEQCFQQLETDQEYSRHTCNNCYQVDFFKLPSNLYDSCKLEPRYFTFCDEDIEDYEFECEHERRLAMTAQRKMEIKAEQKRQEKKEQKKKDFENKIKEIDGDFLKPRIQRDNREANEEKSRLKEIKYLKRHFGKITEEEIIIKINEEEILEGMEHLRVKV